VYENSGLGVRKLRNAQLSSCGAPNAKTTVTGARVLAGTNHYAIRDPRPSAPSGAQGLVALAVVAGLVGLLLVAFPSRRAAVGRLIVAVVGVFVTLLLAVILSLSAFFGTSSLGPGYWLGFFGFLAGALVEVVNLIRGRNRWELGDQLRAYDFLFPPGRWPRRRN